MGFSETTLITAAPIILESNRAWGARLPRVLLTNFATATLGNAADYFGIETADTRISSSEDGAMIEAGVAGFLHDITDAANEAKDPLSSYPYSYVGAVVKTCSVDSLKPSGVDHLIFCLERQIDPDVTNSSVYFPNRSSFPSTYSESATEPSTWSWNDLRTNWTWILYNE